MAPEWPIFSGPLIRQDTRGGREGGVGGSLWPSSADNQGFLKRRVQCTGDDNQPRCSGVAPRSVTEKEDVCSHPPPEHARRGNWTTAKHKVTKASERGAAMANADTDHFLPFQSTYNQSMKRERRLSTLAAVWRQWHGKWRVTHPPHAAPTICEDHASPFCDGTPKEEGNGRRNQEKKEDVIQRIIGNDCPSYPVLESAKNMLPESSRLPLPANWPMHTT